MVNDDRYRVRIADGDLVMDERAPLDLEWSVPAADVLREGPAAAWIRERLGEGELARIRELVRHPPPPRALPTVPSLDALREPMWQFTVELATRLGLPPKTAAPPLRAWTCPAPVTDRSEPWSEHVDAWFAVGDAHVAFSASSSYWRDDLRAKAKVDIHVWRPATGLDIVASAEEPRTVRLVVVGDDERAVTALLAAHLGPLGARIVA